MIKSILKKKKVGNPEEDLRLAKQVAKGDEVAMDALYRKYAPQILTVCRRYASGKDEALDMLHDGFLKVFEKIDTYAGKSDLSIWVKRVIINSAINGLRAKTDWEALPEEFPEEEEEKWEEDPGNPEELIALIQELPPGYRTVLNLYVFEEMSHDEIAERLGISPVSSRTQLFKARRLLKKLWKQ